VGQGLGRPGDPPAAPRGQEDRAKEEDAALRAAAAADWLHHREGEAGRDPLQEAAEVMLPQGWSGDW